MQRDFFDDPNAYVWDCTMIYQLYIKCICRGEKNQMSEEMNTFSIVEPTVYAIRFK